MAAINNVNMTPQIAQTAEQVLIEVSMTWPPITYLEIESEPYGALEINRYGDFEGGVTT